MAKQLRLCPVLTQVQAVPRGLGLDVQLLPMGEAKVQTAQDLLATGKRPASMGGLDLSAVGKTLPVYRAQGQAGFMLKTPEGTPKDAPDPPLVADTFNVQCIGAQCQWWSDEMEDCAPVAAAKWLLSRERQNFDQTMSGSEEEPDKEEP